MDEPETEPTLEDLEETRDGLIKTLEWLDKKIEDKQKEEPCKDIAL